MTHAETPNGTRPTIPGVLLSLSGHGVMLCGPSGVGKSDCALSLIERGHALVADDAIQVARADHGLIGSSPEAGFGLLHLRDVGIVDIPRLYGAQAVQSSCTIELQISLDSLPGQPCPCSLLEGRHGSVEYCGIQVPEITITAVSQRPLPTLVEAVVARFCADSKHLLPINLTGSATCNTPTKAQSLSADWPLSCPTPTLHSNAGHSSNVQQEVE